MNNDNLTYQRLDEEDIKTLVIEGYVIGKNVQGLYPTKIEFLELNVIKKTGSRQKFVVYMLLKEEIDRVVSL